MDSELKKVREGEMKFLRAYYYSILITHYGDCPLLLEPVDKPTFNFVRSPQKRFSHKSLKMLRMLIIYYHGLMPKVR